MLTIKIYSLGVKVKARARVELGVVLCLLKKEKSEKSLIGTTTEKKPIVFPFLVAVWLSHFSLSLSLSGESGRGVLALFLVTSVSR